VYLVEEVDLGDSIGGIARVFDQQSYEAYKGVQCVEALVTHARRTLVVFCQRLVAQIHAHLCAQPEEARDEVICMQDALLVHLGAHTQSGVNIPAHSGAIEVE
jgi:hypothetical protein